MHVSLTPIDDNHTDYIIRWRNRDFVSTELFTNAILTRETHEKWLREFVKTGKCHQFIILVGEKSIPVGTTFLKNIDWEVRSAEFGIFIGEGEYLSRGIGAAATRLVLDYAFNSLSMNKVWLEVKTTNHRAVNSYNRVGFTVQAKYPRPLPDGRDEEVVKMQFNRNDYNIMYNGNS